MTAAPRRVSFGTVRIASHACVLDGSKLPSDGLAPLGLGEHLLSEECSVEEHENARATRGVQHLTPEVRRAVVADDPKALLDLERANRELLKGDAAEDSDGAWGPMRFSVDAPRAAAYTTAEPDAKREGLAGGFCEVEAEAEARRKQRALDAAAATAARKAERRRCAGCKRFACIC